MKKIFKIILTMAIINSFIACDETIEPTIYTGDELVERTFLSFPSSIVNLPVTIDDTGSIDITLNSSTKTASERTFNINLITEETTANPLTYNLPASVTIPANSYQGTITITGTDNDLVETNAETIVFSLGNLSENIDFDSNKVTVNIFEVCPVLADFSGTYFMEQITAINPDDNVKMLEDQILEITAIDETSRSFSAIYLEGLGIGNAPTTYTFSLVCNEVIVDIVSSTLSCRPGGAPPSINFGPADSPSTYVATEDLVFEVTINEYHSEDGGCGASPYDTTFRFTKQ